jgi:plasmid stability protein
MTTVRIDLPDAQAAALQAKAAAQGLSLEEWFRKIAGQEAPVNGEVSPRKSAYGLLAQYGPGPSEEEIDDNRKDMSRGFAEDAP